LRVKLLTASRPPGRRGIDIKTATLATAPERPLASIDAYRPVGEFMPSCHLFLKHQPASQLAACEHVGTNTQST